MIDCEFMSCMGDDDLVVDAARVSFNKQAGNYSDSRNDSLINFLAREKHYAPFSHPHATFRCTAPIFVARQLAKHQVGGTWNEVSRRYVKDTPTYWEPEFLRAAGPDIKQGSLPDEHRRSAEFIAIYKTLYYDAWKLGCKGITTFRAAGKRYGILNKPKEEEPAAEACYIDPATGQKSCE